MTVQPKRRKALSLTFVFACLAAIPGCVIGTHTETPQASLTFVNDSDQIVVFAEGTTIEDAIDPLQSPPSSPRGPGQTTIFSLQIRSDDTWCMAPNRFLWVLGSTTNPTEREAFPTPLDIDDMVVLDQIGPGSCWDADSTYAYGG